MRFSREQPYQLLGSAETEARLEQLLRLKISDRGSEKIYELTQFPIFMKQKSAKKALAWFAQDLETLALRAHPIYEPIIAEYSEITALLLRGKTLAVPKRLERLQSLRKGMMAQMREIDDYLNWFEATSMAQPSGEFADYFKAAQRARQPEQTKRDPISVYLDALETQFDTQSTTVR